jgi:hypothetical protein
MASFTNVCQACCSSPIIFVSGVILPVEAGISYVSRTNCQAISNLFSGTFSGLLDGDRDRVRRGRIAQIVLRDHLNAIVILCSREPYAGNEVSQLADGQSVDVDRDRFRPLFCCSPSVGVGYRDRTAPKQLCPCCEAHTGQTHPPRVGNYVTDNPSTVD